MRGLVRIATGRQFSEGSGQFSEPLALKMEKLLSSSLRKSALLFRSAQPRKSLTMKRQPLKKKKSLPSKKQGNQECKE